MVKTVTFPRLSIWNLVRLQHELEEASVRLDRIINNLDQGHIDLRALDATIRQVQKCNGRLKAALSERKSDRRQNHTGARPR